jgi:hypothetical protein
MPNPFSENIIFFDTEFSDLDPYKGEILSLGMVKPNGQELYLEIEYNGEVSDWVKDNVIPYLKGPKLSRNEAKLKIREFVGPAEPYLVSYVNQFDAIYWYKLFGVDDHPAYWIPIDFASILFGFGINPEDYSNPIFLKELGIEAGKYQKHNALEDAKLLREIYLKFFEKYGKAA